MDFKQIYYGFREYERQINFYEEIIGDIDYTGRGGGLSTKKHSAKAIVLPLSIAREFFKGQVSQDDKYERCFFLKLKDVKVFPSFYVVYKGERYNVKDVIELDSTYSLLNTKAVRGEATYEQ